MASTENTSASLRGCDQTGWLFHLINEGWLRKRWRRRWCVLRHGSLAIFEFQAVEESDKPCSQIDLINFTKCIKARKKDASKSRHTFVLELANSGKLSEKGHKQIFYAENEREMTVWMEKLNEAIRVAGLCDGKSLEHVTKARVKPNSSGRRPPSRTHIRDRAQKSEMATTVNGSLNKEEPTGKRGKPGKIPAIAMKPGASCKETYVPSSEGTASEIVENFSISQTTHETESEQKQLSSLSPSRQPEGASSAEDVHEENCLTVKPVMFSTIAAKPPHQLGDLKDRTDSPPTPPCKTLKPVAKKQLDSINHDNFGEVTANSTPLCDNTHSTAEVAVKSPEGEIHDALCPKDENGAAILGHQPTSHTKELSAPDDIDSNSQVNSEVETNVNDGDQ